MVQFYSPIKIVNKKFKRLHAVPVDRFLFTARRVEYETGRTVFGSPLGKKWKKLVVCRKSYRGKVTEFF